MRSRKYRKPTSAVPLFALIAVLLASCGGFSGKQQKAQALKPFTGTPDVIVDFGNRTNPAASIPQGFLSVNASDLGPQNAQAYSLLSAAGVARIRVDGLVPQVYATPIPDWTRIDPVLNAIRSAGISRVTIVFSYTPVWLQPNPDDCTLPWAAAPSDLQQYAALATAYVQHMDQQFPGLVDTYEIWNEPDTNFYFCVPDPARAAVPAYLRIYAAVAPAMRAQAKVDGAQVMIGGPTLAVTLPVTLSAWMTPLLNDPTTAPYVDFVSVHHYVTNFVPTAGMTWDTSNPSMLSITQDSDHGMASMYERVSAIVRAGRPNAATIPILITEYNTDPGSTDCCRNSPIYSPVWNSLVIADLLNTAYAGTRQLPTTLSYFNLSGPHFHSCMMGIVDAAMDCNFAPTAPMQPYPQYYAFQLVGSPAYLDLGSGGFMATSITTSTINPGVITTAFYTTKQNSVLLVNTGAKDIPSLSVMFRNVGSTTSAVATVFLLNQANQTIITTNVELAAQGLDRVAAVPVPAYSVVGLDLHQ